MKIGVNGRFLVAKRTGVQRAAYNLLKALVRVDRENQYVIFTGSEQLDNPDWKWSNVEVIPSGIKGGENLKNYIWEQVSLPRLARKHGVDILHSPANMAPLFYSGKSVINIHDLCFVVNPQWYSFQFRTFYNFVIPRLARGAAKVITNSNNSKNDLLQFCNISAEKVSLIYWAVDTLFASQVAEQLKDDVERPWLDEDYFLYVGSLEPRKNIRTLIEAYQLLRDQNPDCKAKLILIGGESPLFAQVKLNIKRYAEDVVFKGFVSDELLNLYYKRATVAVYPSLYEGFGLPPLEAMASGTPVITSNSSSLPEVVGEAAILINPLDVQALADAMQEVLTKPELREKLKGLGAEQIKKFNWQRVARATLAVFHEVYHTPSDGLRVPMPIERWKSLREPQG